MVQRCEPKARARWLITCTSMSSMSKPALLDVQHTLAHLSSKHSPDAKLKAELVAAVAPEDPARGERLVRAVSRLARELDPAQWDAAVEDGVLPAILPLSPRTLAELSGGGPIADAIGDAIKGAARAITRAIGPSTPSPTGETIDGGIRG